MSRPARKPDSVRPGRRYLVHLLCSWNEGNAACRYTARIHPWANRASVPAETHERVFTDEYELIDTINELLPPGSDVRDVLSHIESADGFFYVLDLSPEEAARLGWHHAI